MGKYIFGKEETVYSGSIFKIFHRPVTLPDGTKKVFEHCERPDSASVLAFNDKNELLMIKEHRPGYKHNVWFLPSGRVDKGESPRQAAMRELREESGYAAKIIKKVHKKSPSSTLRWDIHVFAAKNIYWSPLPRDPGEHMTVHFISLKKAVQMALNGEIDNEFISYNIIRFNEMLKNKEFTW